MSRTAPSGLALHGDVRPEHRVLLARMLEATPSFDHTEVAVALELLDAALCHPEQGDYRFLFAEDARGLAGYVCYGPTPMTAGTFDLYWLATHPDRQRQGVGRALVAAMEERLRDGGARLVRVETSSQESYGGARKFYLAAGYTESAVLADFYKPGDDLVIFTKRLGTPTSQVSPGRTDFEVVYDLAFSYRDFDREREFLLSCARKWGRAEPGRVLEWACGPARHLESFARRGGTACVGVDLSPAMVDLARRRFGHLEGVAVSVGDVRSTVVAPPVDLAFTMLSSIHGLASEDELVQHLETCARSLAPGGLYVIEATHPRDLTEGGTHETEWEQREQDAVVTGHFSLDLASHDGARVLASLELSHTVGEQRRRYTLEMPWLVLDMSAWRRAIARVPELELVACLGDLDVGAPFDRPTAWRLVLVLRRAG